MFKSKLSKVIVSLLRRIAGVTRSGAKRLMRAMLQALMAMGRRARLPVAGFVLPTVTMVLLVVILLTVAIVFRSFDRGNMARNVRVNQQVLAAATPAIDRAKAKIEYLLGPGNQVTGTPSDRQLYQAMSSYPDTPTATNPDLYTFGDEQRLVLRADLSQPPNGITPNDNPKGSLFSQAGAENEAINTAWRYPVDTNNDGNFDTFTLYGIYFRTPRPPAGTAPRKRKELDARTPPMRTGSINSACEQGEGTVASLVGDSGWERITGRLQKSFFVYTVNVPITADDIQKSALDATKFEAFKGTSSVSALEYQQDQSRIPLSNNAVVYEDDLDISPGPPLNLNGRIFTNSNLLVTSLNAPNTVQLFQVSSQESCFYDQENSRIVVGGNVVNGWSGSDGNRNPVGVHLFTIGDNTPITNPPPIIDNDNQSVAQNSLRVLYNNAAYSQRLDALVQGQIQADPDPGSNDPASVRQAQQAPKNQSRIQALEDYFKERLRKVPFAEPAGVVAGTNYIEGTGESLRPIEAWSLPNGTATLGAVAGPTGLTIRPTQLQAQEPQTLLPTESERFLGNRVTVGNNLPAQRWNGATFTNDDQPVDGITEWEDSDVLRTRTPQVTKLGDAGATDRGNGVGQQPGVPGSPNPFSDGFWERSAAEKPRTPLDGIGGLRVITSAGVYDRTNSFLPPPTWIHSDGTRRTGPASTIAAPPPPVNTYDDPETPVADAVEQYPVVWPDSMPMSPLGPGSQVWNNTTFGPNPGGWTPWLPGWSTPIDISATLPVAQQNPNPNFVNETRNVANRQFAKGDLRMRATAVYQYANSNFDATTPATQPTQTPLACVSSYYDPSNASTARNILPLGVPPLPDVSGEGANAPDVLAIPQLAPGIQQAFIGSNNGITYGPPDREQSPRSNLTIATGLLGGGDAILEAQANMVFPDGRFANGPLRTALQVPPLERTLAQQAAIDSTNCALQILDGSIGRSGLIPDGAIQEVAFINGREVKAIDRDDPNTIVNEAFTLSSPLGTAAPAAQLTGNYNQPLEEREPLEIRATQLDLAQLKNSPAPTIGDNGPATEFLLPNSGIIYASRDDALPDRSSRSATASTDKTLSPTDYLLDPTRKPNGIVLINGQQLFRGPGPNPIPPANLNAVVIEKGLTLVSNLPAYIKGNFNLHGNLPPATPGNPPPDFTQVEEFTQLLAENPFYDRIDLDPNFACRNGDPRLPNCTVGDFWRPATVLADAVTLLSQHYRFGFRNEGDFDLRNNAGAAAVLPRRQQGFYNNNFVTNGLSSGAFLANGNLNPSVVGGLTDTTYVAPVAQPNVPLWSSYFNNFVTPVQRRGNFPEYVMEVCTIIPVAACRDADWLVDPLADGNAPRTAATAAASGYVEPNPILTTQSFQAGSTVDPPLPALQRFPRRVAFQRGSANPPPFGITDLVGTITAGGVGRLRDNALWFAANNAGTVTYDATNLPYVVNNTTNTGTPGTRDGSIVPLPTLAAASSTILPVTVPPALPAPYSGSQPLLVPVPQIMNVTAATRDEPRGQGGGVQQTGWIPQAVNANNNGTTFNLIVGAGDTPSRALNNEWGDFNGGLQNLPRFLESFSAGGEPISNNIRGSFIQQNRSAFSTAPYLPILPPSFVAPTPLQSLFALGPNPLPGSQPLITYNIQGARIPYFTPPTRNWGYDVGLLSQPPDLFTQKFTTPSTRTQPAEYFREVPRNDPWVTTLMCGVTDNAAAANATETLTTAERANCL